MADVLGYAASLAVLATFLMRTMVPLRLVAILSNVLFLVFGCVQHIYPVFFLHLALLPINAWRLVSIPDGKSLQSGIFGAVPVNAMASRPYAFWFAFGLLTGLAGSLAVVLMANAQHI